MRLEEKQAVGSAFRISAVCLAWAMSAALLDTLTGISPLLALGLGSVGITALIWVGRYGGMSWLRWATPTIGLLTIFFGFELRRGSDNLTAAFFVVLLLSALASSVMTMRNSC